MIFVDTSVWVSYLRGTDLRIPGKIDQLLEQDAVGLPVPVRVELLAGTSAQKAPQLGYILSALPLFYPSHDIWSLIENWVNKAVTLGQRFGFGDLLIGAIAAEQGGYMWSLDSDFARMEKLKFLKCFSPQE